VDLFVGDKMKKAFILLSFIFILFGCTNNTFPKIKRNFIKEGYTYSNEIGKYLEFDEELVFTPHVFILKEGIINNVAIVLEFHNKKEIEETIEKSETLKGIIKDLKKSEYVNGNCVLLPLIPLSVTIDDMVKVFNK